MYSISLVGAEQRGWWGPHHWHISQRFTFSWLNLWVLKLFLIFKSLSDLSFQCVFGHVNDWVLLLDGFRWNPDILGGVGICLWLILDDTSLKMSKNCFCLCSCMHGLKLAYAALLTPGPWTVRKSLGFCSTTCHGDTSMCMEPVEGPSRWLCGCSHRTSSAFSLGGGR